MKIDTAKMFSITEANQNFSKVVKSVEQGDRVVILKNNKPQYVVSKFDDNQISENELVLLVARAILTEHKKAFEELAK